MALIDQRVLEEFIEDSRGMTFAPGFGMRGIVWQKGKDQWVMHCTDDGVGFDIVKVARRQRSVGLLAMRERAELIEQLIADTAKDIDPMIEKAWGDEALRRLEEIESGKAKGIPLKAAMARVRKTVGL